MAKNVFRITPRASQVIRAIEGQFQAEHDDICREVDAPLQRVVFNAGDFVFGESNRWGRVEVRVSNLEMAYTLRDDPEFALYHHEFEGVIVLQQHRVKNRGEKDFVYYTTESIQLTRIAEADESPLSERAEQAEMDYIDGKITRERRDEILAGTADL